MPLNIDFQQILLHLLNFVVLFGILYFLLYRPVKKFMDSRAEYYENLDKKAKEDLAKAQQEKDEFREKLDHAGEEISARAKKAYEEAEARGEEQILKAKQQAEKILEDARKSIENDREKMLQEARKEITDMVADAAEKLVPQTSTSQAFDDFLSAAERGEKDE